MLKEDDKKNIYIDKYLLMRMVTVELEACSSSVGNSDWNIFIVFLLHSLNVENKICKNINHSINK